jgi:hypothetical protein
MKTSCTHPAATFLFKYGCVCSDPKKLTHWRGGFRIILKVSLFVPVNKTKVIYSAVKYQIIVHTPSKKTVHSPLTLKSKIFSFSSNRMSKVPLLIILIQQSVSGEGLRWNALVVLSHRWYNI